MKNYLDQVKWNVDGLVPAIAQDSETGSNLMVAWMNRAALEETVETQRAVYWSRSRKTIWRKGEQSGHVQLVDEIRLDCDNDVVLLQVRQQGGIACHTGRKRCFYQVYTNGEWQVAEPIIKDPKEIYK